MLFTIFGSGVQFFFCIPINKGKQAAKAVYPIFVRRLLISNEKKWINKIASALYIRHRNPQVGCVVFALRTYGCNTLVVVYVSIYLHKVFGLNERYSEWNLIYVLRACIAVAAIWCDSGLVYWVCIACTKLTTITLHTKPPGWMCFNEIRCNAEYAFSLHQNSTPQRIADGALHLACSNYLFIIWWRTSFSVFCL